MSCWHCLFISSVTVCSIYYCLCVCVCVRAHVWTTGRRVHSSRRWKCQIVQASHRALEGAQQRPASLGQPVEEETHGPHDGGAPPALWLLQHGCETGQTERHRGASSLLAFDRSALHISNDKQRAFCYWSSVGWVFFFLSLSWLF